MGLQLIQHAMRQRRGIEDGMAAVHHMIVERQNHQRRVGDDSAEDARVHGIKITRFGVDSRPQTGDGFFRWVRRRLCDISHGYWVRSGLEKRDCLVCDRTLICDRTLKGERNQLSKSGLGKVTKGTPSSVSSAVSSGVAVPWMGRSSVLPVWI